MCGSVIAGFDSSLSVRHSTYDRSWFAQRGTWDTQGGVLNNRTAAANDIVYMNWQGTTDYTADRAHAQPVRRSR